MHLPLRTVTVWQLQHKSTGKIGKREGRRIKPMPGTLRMDNQWHIPTHSLHQISHKHTHTTGGETYFLDIVIRHQTLRFILIV